MRVRHRIPSIFNLSMVDVLCCALGCVILLWLVNLREAQQRSDAAGQTKRERDEARAERDQARLESQSLAGRLSQAEDRLRRSHAGEDGLLAFANDLDRQLGQLADA